MLYIPRAQCDYKRPLLELASVRDIGCLEYRGTLIPSHRVVKYESQLPRGVCALSSYSAYLQLVAQNVRLLGHIIFAYLCWIIPIRPLPPSSAHLIFVGLLIHSIGPPISHLISRYGVNLLHHATSCTTVSVPAQHVEHSEQLLSLPGVRSEKIQNVPIRTAAIRKKCSQTRKVYLYDRPSK